MSKAASPIERAARALCSLDGHPENAMMDGKPLWQDYLPEVRAVIAAIQKPSTPMVVAGDWAFRYSIRLDKAALAWEVMIAEIEAVDE